MAVIVLCACWVVLVRRVLAGRAGPRSALLAGLAWTVPFALGPPLFSRDVYAYAAQGELARRGLDPATHGVAELGADPAGAAFVAAVDPRWRETHTPYGGGAVAIEKLAAVGTDLFGTGPAGAVVILRVVAVLAVLAALGAAVRLARQTLAGTAGAPGSPQDADTAADTAAGAARFGPAVVIALFLANPVIVIHLVGGAHLDAVAALALTLALVADNRRAARAGRTGGPARGRARLLGPAGLAATACAAAAGTIKATMFLGVGWLVVAHASAAWRQAADGPPGQPERASATCGPSVGRALAGVAAVVAADLAVTLAVLGLSVLASGFPPTWVAALGTSSTLTTGVAPASILAALIAAVAGLAGADLSPDGGPLLAACRALALATAGVVVALLLVRAWRRPAPPAPTATVPPWPAGAWDGPLVLGIGGLAVALGSPVLYPWYLGPALPMLAVLVAGWWLARRPGRRAWLVLALVLVWSVCLCLSTLSPLADTWDLIGPAGVAALAALAVGAVLTGGALAWRARRRGRAAAAS